MRPLALAALGLLWLLPMVAAHGQENHLDDQLVRNGQRLMVGGFDAAQPGPLLVVPYLDGALECGSDRSQFMVPLSGSAGVQVVANATHILAEFDTPGSGYHAFAVDTADAVRSLILMQEQAVSLHVLAAYGVPPDGGEEAAPALRVGLLGIPYAIPGASMHSLGHAVEGGGIAMQYAHEPIGLERCEAEDRLGFLISREVSPQTLQSGLIVHALALYDAQVPQLLPRPLNSTEVLQVNLYLARPGEDPTEISRALDARPGPVEGTAMGGLVFGLAWASRRILLPGS